MILRDYLHEIQLPNIPIESMGEISCAFIKKDICTLWDAVEHIHKLPYGRTSSRENYFQVLNESRGACSTKHALLAGLAEEMMVPLKLVFGLFILNAKNTPRLLPILECHQLEGIPEAHCYLRYQNSYLDITFPESTEFSVDLSFEEEIYISPQQIGLFKIERHKQFIEYWIKNKPNIQLNSVWNAREQWIQKLSESNINKVKNND